MIKIELINPIKEAQTNVRTVNGMSGDVFLTAKDVEALPASTHIPSIAGLATEKYVDQKVKETQLGGEVDLDEYATKDYVDNIILEAEESGMLENYYTKDEVEAKYRAHVAQEIEGLASEEYVDEKVANLDVDVDLTGYATEKYVDDKHLAQGQEFTAVLESVVNDMGTAIDTTYAKKTEIPDVSAYQTAEQVNAAITSALDAIGVAEEGEY